jgi:hypothetical protein
MALEKEKARWQAMSFEKAIKTIIELNEEIKAIKILMDCVEDMTENLEKDNAEMASCLRAIKKINKNKNDSIDALCERRNDNEV